MNVVAYRRRAVELADRRESDRTSDEERPQGGLGTPESQPMAAFGDAVCARCGRDIFARRSRLHSCHRLPASVRTSGQAPRASAAPGASYPGPRGCRRRPRQRRDWPAPRWCAAPVVDHRVAPDREIERVASGAEIDDVRATGPLRTPRPGRRPSSNLFILVLEEAVAAAAAAGRLIDGDRCWSRR